MPSEEELKKLITLQLKEIIDPELGINIVDLGLIYEIDLKKAGKVSEVSKVSNAVDVEITMTLTTPGCPLSFVFQEWVPAAVKKVDGVREVMINLVWEPAWDPDKISDDAKEEMGIIR